MREEYDFSNAIRNPYVLDKPLKLTLQQPAGLAFMEEDHERSIKMRTKPVTHKEMIARP